MTHPAASATDTPIPAAPTNPALPNGQGVNPHALPSRVPQSQQWSRRKKLILGGGGALAILLLLGTILLVRGSFRTKRADLEPYHVKRELLELTIIERGALESSRNSDIYCTVKAGQKGSTNASIIKWLLEDGSSVKKGDPVIILDDSGFQDQYKTQKIVVDNAQAAKIQAEQAYEIQLSQNESDIKSAEVALEIAEIDLKKYQEGDYPQQLKIFEGNIKQAESDVEQQRDRVAWANRMVKKGYLTVTQSQGEQSKLESLQITLTRAEEDRRVLTDPIYGTGKRQITFLQNDVTEKKRALERVRSQAKAKEVQAKIDRDTKKSVYDQEATKLKEIDDEIRKCKIYAPQDGLVVYFVPEQARGGGAQQGIIAQGEPVREGQKLMQIPDLHHMIVNTKVHEALVSKVKKGQPVRVRVDSFPDLTLEGSVESVATVSAQQDFFAADVKVYTTKIKIKSPPEGLKPGMSAEAKITIAAALENVVTLPVQAIVGSVEMGKTRKCFVLTPDGPVEREITVGQSNNSKAEITSGLKEGEDVVLNPGALLSEKDRSKVGKPGENKSDDDRPQGAPDKGKKPPQPAGEPGNSPGGDKPKVSAEEREKMFQQKLEKYRAAGAEERKKLLEAENPAYRDKVKERLKAAGVEIED